MTKIDDIRKTFFEEGNTSDRPTQLTSVAVENINSPELQQCCSDPLELLSKDRGRLLPFAGKEQTKKKQGRWKRSVPVLRKKGDLLRIVAMSQANAGIIALFG